MKINCQILIPAIILFLPILSISQSENDKSKLLILGTYHLSQIDNFQPAMLDQLIVKLDSFDFDVICVENMPSRLLYDIQSRNDSAFTEVLESFGGERLIFAKKAQDKYNINFLEAQEKASEILHKPFLTVTDRKLLIKYFIASADLASATLQYITLKRDAKIDTAGIGKEFIIELERLSGLSDEMYSLGLRMAQKEDLSIIHYIDNFQDEALLMKYYPGFINEYIAKQDKFKDIGKHPVFQKTAKLIESGSNKNGLLELYLFLNSKEYQKQDYEAQWEIWFNTEFDSGSDLGRYSLWEMRNLQIASNILEVIAQHPAKKVLVIIGASHKSFLEKHLHNIPNIELLELR